MGNSSSSSVTNTNNTLIVNDTDINILNQTLNSAVANTTINDAKQCSSSINQLQSVNFGPIKSEGDVTINLTQNQTAAMTFSCLNTSSVQNQISNTMLANMMNSIESTNSSDVLAKLDAQASASQTSGIIPTSFGDSTSSNANNTTNFTQRNTNYQNLQNVVQNCITNNFTTNTLSSCIAKVNGGQEVQTQSITSGGNVLIAVNQDQAASVFTQCIQQANVGNSITSGLLTTLGVKTTVANETKVQNELTGESTATQTLGASCPGCGNSCSSCGGSWIGSLIVIVILVIVLVVGFIVVKKLMKGKGDGDGDGDGDKGIDAEDDDQKGGYLQNILSDGYKLFKLKYK